MKSALPAVLVMLCLVLAAAWIHDRGLRTAQLRAERAALDTARVRAQVLDASLAASRRDADSLRTELQRRLTARRTTTTQLGSAVAHHLDSARVTAAALVCTDSAGVAVLLAELAAADSARAAQALALVAERAAADALHRADSLRLVLLQTSAIPALQAQRDTAHARLARALAVRQPRTRPGWLKALAGGSCVAGGAAAATDRAGTAAVAVAVCAAGLFIL